MLKKTNLKRALTKNREQVNEEALQGILDEAFNHLHDEYCHEQRIQRSLKEGGRQTEPFSWAELDPEAIFSLKDIRKTAIQYRLRFLDASMFKEELPYEAIARIKALEKKLGVPLKEFKILAPGEKFQLEDCDKDPVLFLQLSDNYHYMVHQWGKDLAWYRKMAATPVRSFTSLGLTIASVSLLLAMCIPTSLVGVANGHEVFARLAFFFWCLVCITSIVTYIGFAFFKNVSVNQWDSPFFKQEF